MPWADTEADTSNHATISTDLFIFFSGRYWLRRPFPMFYGRQSQYRPLILLNDSAAIKLRGIIRIVRVREGIKGSELAGGYASLRKVEYYEQAASAH